jgi:hypothetical protein
MRDIVEPMPERFPPEFGWPFLAWLQATTERAWQHVRPRTLSDYQRAGVGGCSWQRGTRWTGGLTDRELESVEGRFGVRFPPDHRLFLQVLHATTPRMSGAYFVDGTRLESVERPGFYNWLQDEQAIRSALDSVVAGIAFDVEHAGLWPESWGSRPTTERDRSARVAELVAKAPRLLPIFGHRFVLADGPTLILSVYQSDIIVYGQDLRAYLLNELCDLIGLESDPSWTNADTSAIPFWGELIG